MSAKRGWWKGAGRAGKNGSRVSWEPYNPAAFGELRQNEVLTMDDGCTAERRGDWLRWVEPAALVQEIRERRAAIRAKASADLEAEAEARLERRGAAEPLATAA